MKSNKIYSNNYTVGTSEGGLIAITDLINDKKLVLYENEAEYVSNELKKLLTDKVKSSNPPEDQL